MAREKGLHRLNEFPSHKGGDTCVYGGYVWEYCPEHRLQNKWGWVAQHRLVAETMLGRPLVQSKDPTIGEVVHHEDECRTNNAPENLRVMTMRAHRKHHARQMADRQMARLNTQNVSAALVGRTIREAAAALNTTHMTIRNRFPELIAHKKRRSPAEIADPSWKDRIAPHLSDTRLAQRDVAKILGMKDQTFRKILRVHGIAWPRRKPPGRPVGSKDKFPRKPSRLK